MYTENHFPRVHYIVQPLTFISRAYFSCRQLLGLSVSFEEVVFLKHHICRTLCAIYAHVHLCVCAIEDINFLNGVIEFHKHVCVVYLFKLVASWLTIVRKPLRYRDTYLFILPRDIYIIHGYIIFSRQITILFSE